MGIPLQRTTTEQGAELGSLVPTDNILKTTSEPKAQWTL